MLSTLGPPEIVLPVMLTSAASFGLCLVALRNNTLADAFPTLAWLSFIQLPFILNSGGISLEIATTQMLGLSFFTLAFFVGDFCAIRARNGMPNEALNPISGRSQRIIIISLSLLVLLIPIYHLANVQTIPALIWLTDVYAPHEVSESREDFGKLLEVPNVMKYAFNWVMSVFGPILIVTLLFAKRFLWAAMFGIWLVAYALLSTAKAPITIFVLLTVVGTTPLWGFRLTAIARYCVFISFVTLMVAGIIRSVGITQEFNEGVRFKTSFLELQKGLLEEFPERGFSLSDVDRFREAQANQPFRNTYKYLVYRVFLTPVEVSYHWYTYFPKYADGWRSVEEVAGVRSEGQAHAANRVGVWAYRQFFPTKYAPTVSAYASIDADAYAFGGLFSVGLAAFITFICRILIIPVMRESQLGQACGLMMLTFLGIFPASASLQAILIPQGFGLILFFCGLLLLRSKLTKPH